MASPSLKEPIPGPFLNPSAAPEPLPSFPHCWDSVSPPGERRSTGSLLGPPWGRRSSLAGNTHGLLLVGECIHGSAPSSWLDDKQEGTTRHPRQEEMRGRFLGTEEISGSFFEHRCSRFPPSTSPVRGKKGPLPRAGEFINHRWLAQPSSHQSQAGSAHRGSLWTCPSSSEVFHSAGTKPPSK